MYASGIDLAVILNHSRVGTATLILMITNVCIGLLSFQHYTFVKRNQAYIRLIHRLNGRSIVILSFANAFLGIADLATNESRKQYQFALAVYITVLILGFVLFGEFDLHRTLYEWSKETSKRVTKSLDSLNDSKKNTAQVNHIRFSWSEFNERVMNGANWLVISGIIYDVSNFVLNHPGGSQLINEHIGTNATRSFYGTISKSGDFNQVGATKGEDKPEGAAANNKIGNQISARPTNLHSKVAMVMAIIQNDLDDFGYTIRRINIQLWCCER
jgi:hypothetical protein